jgi:membrane-bound lytic murein transglycosylase B
MVRQWALARKAELQDNWRRARAHLPLEKIAGPDGRINGGRAMLQRHPALLSQIETRFGVPRQILVAIWGWRHICFGIAEFNFRISEFSLDSQVKSAL